jgi:hypothetical protein
MPEIYQNGAEQCLELWKPMGFFYELRQYTTVSKFTRTKNSF